MAKKTVDEMIGQLPRDRQQAIFDKAEKINASRAKARTQEENGPDRQAAQFEPLDDVIARLSPERQTGIEAGAETLSREIEASRLKSGVTVESLEEKRKENE